MVSYRTNLDKYSIKSQPLLRNETSETISSSTTYAQEIRQFQTRYPIKELKQKTKMVQLMKLSTPSVRLKTRTSDISKIDYSPLNNYSNGKRSAYMTMDRLKKSVDLKQEKNARKFIDNGPIKTSWNNTFDFDNIPERSFYLPELNLNYYADCKIVKSRFYPQKIISNVRIDTDNKSVSKRLILFSPILFIELPIGICEKYSKEQKLFVPFWNFISSSLTITSSLLLKPVEIPLSVINLKGYSILFQEGTRINTSISTPIYRFSQDSTLLDQKDINPSESYKSENSKSLNREMPKSKMKQLIQSEKMNVRPNMTSDSEARSYLSQIELFIGNGSLWRIMERFNSEFRDNLQENPDFMKNSGQEINWEMCDPLKQTKRAVSNNFLVKSSTNILCNSKVAQALYYAEDRRRECKYLKSTLTNTSSEEFYSIKESSNGHLKVHFKNQVEEIPPMPFSCDSGSFDEMFSFNNQNGFIFNLRSKINDSNFDAIIEPVDDTWGLLCNGSISNFRINSNVVQDNKYDMRSEDTGLSCSLKRNVGQNFEILKLTNTGTNENNKDLRKDIEADTHDPNIITTQGIYSAYAVIYEPNVYNPTENLESHTAKKNRNSITIEYYDNIDSSDLRKKTSFRSKIKQILSGNRQRPSTAYIDLSSEFTTTVTDSSPYGLPTKVEPHKTRKSCCFKKEKKDTKNISQ